jgi:hypothetical protein
MAALGNSDDGVTQNPSVLRQERSGQLKNVTIEGRSFTFDDADAPTQVSVEFTVAEGAPERDLHLAVFILPGPFDYDEVDEQELYAVANGTFAGGETGTLTLSVPQPPGPLSSLDELSPLLNLGLSMLAVGLAIVGRRRQF